jgi:glycosyltransferase involved in cell wall biosynthesis
MHHSHADPRLTASLLFFAYNHERFVEEALLSALRQDVEAFELVVVDDASTDRTRAILEEVLARETPPGVTIRRLYKDKNAGLMTAVNDAMAMATGEAFVLMSGDDVSMSCRLARSLRTFADQPSVQLVYGDCVKIDEAGIPFASPEAEKSPQFFSYDEARLTRIYAGSSPFGAAAAYRRRLFDFFGPMGAGEHGEDNCYWIRALMLGEIYRDPACFVHWRQHAGNLSNFTAQLSDEGWRRRHLEWMEKHATISRQWLKDIALARDARLISWTRAQRLKLAALREDRTWALEASSLRCDPWGEWSKHALRLLGVGRISTTLKMLKLRFSPWRQERKWRFWAKLKSNPAA